MFLRIIGGFCFGLGISFILGLIVLIPAIRQAFDTVADPAGWYGPLEGLFRGSLMFAIGTIVTVLVGLIAGVFCALFSARHAGAWAYIGYPVLAAPIVFVFLFVQSSSRASRFEADRAAAQSKEISKVSREAMNATAERVKTESRAKAVAIYGDAIGGPAEMDQIGRLMGNLYYPGAFIGPKYASRTEPPTIEWPVVSLRCPSSKSFEEVTAYYRGICGAGAESAEGVRVIRPGDKESGRLYISLPEENDTEKKVVVTFIADGF